ncbi:voltage-gated chloride channel family protein [Chitinophaga sp. GCM10012297]|uniref:Voltage-gated chloride channel family protein n=1 Tax=Chitinophaga chungangae TaxID=2821488 RepID=A0ABS3YCR4_9BACT|nr:voltage-gated chloride channel family protein [Chitinophaga chungangae]MBO9152093.1 voltage-gated chloride channel family protein [Chitinophaga chungangae]
MKNLLRNFEQIFVAKHLLFWTLIAVPVALAAGSAVALFLWLLDLVTVFRWQHEWLLYLLPLAGVGIHFLYKAAGKNAEAGNNLIMDEIHQPGGGVPGRMAPLVLVTTLVTHLFGGSAGREGTAVQMGGSMAQLLGRWFGLKPEDIRIILMMGIAAGFGAVFGTPLAGAVFALEVLAIGRIKYNALLPCLMASLFADIVCSAWGIRHTHYVIQSSAALDYLLLLKVILAGVAFGLAGNLFAAATHQVKKLGNRVFTTHKWLMPVTGGLLVILLTFVAGTQDYLGLGVTSKDPGGISIVNAFHAQGVNDWSWLWKLVFTAVTLGMGFKGGEVTPLFFVGAALGHTIAVYAGAPVDLFAGLGFIAVFAGATNTPLACTLMSVELFGPDHVLYFAVACFTAYYFSGHSGIYAAQRMAVSKRGEERN